ncbi:unnamed protein product [Pylaiella littoralis]
MDTMETGTTLQGGHADAHDGHRHPSFPFPAIAGSHDVYSEEALAAVKKTIAINKVSVLQSLMISGLQLALTLNNALESNAFEFESGADLIFAGSSLMEGVGAVFSLWLAAIAFLRPAGDGTVGSGIPVMVLWEGISTGSTELISKGLYRGIWAQAFVFLVTLSVSWGVAPGTRPDWAFENSTGQTVGLVFIFLWVGFCALAILTVRGGCSIVLALHLGIIPLGVEVYESVLLFSSDTSTFSTYILAVLNLIVVAPALVLVPVYFRFLRDEDRRRHAPKIGESHHDQ